MYKILGFISIILGLALIFGIMPVWEEIFGPAFSKEGGTLASLTMMAMFLGGGVIFVCLGFLFLRKGRQALPD